jgi:hypothetical protein
MARLFALLLPPGLLLALLGGPTPARPPAGPPPVKLVVVVYFDQLRGDFLDRWAPLFGDGGFRRLTGQGAWFADCHYPYASTTTGPGHASVLAGCGGAVHGIINNNWYDRTAGQEVYCAASDRYAFVPEPVLDKPAANAKVDAKRKTPKQAGNPDRLLAETVADRVKAAGGRVFGLSLKDRSAIFPSGHKPDGAYWFDGRFHTSTYYRDTLPGWVQAFNESKAADRWVGKAWERLRPDLDYTAHSGPDDGPGEGVGRGPADRKQGKTFPHPFPGEVGQEYYEAVANSPAGNDLLLAFAKACVEAEKLGTGDKPDLLTVSFSSNDLIGHTWGPDSQEVLDVTLRSDRTMADLLGYLDQKVGAGKYAVLLTADHGVCPNPEVSAAKGLDAKRIPPKPLVLAAERFLQETFGKPAGGDADRNLWLEKLSPPHVYLNHRLLRAKGIDPDAAAAKLAAWLPTQPGIQAALPRSYILSPDRRFDQVRDQVRACYHPDRGGDVVVVTKPLYLLDDQGTGTSHGTPHEYDTHVPLVVLAPGVPGGKRSEPVTPLHAAAVVSRLLGVEPPKTARYPAPATLFGK